MDFAFQSDKGNLLQHVSIGRAVIYEYFPRAQFGVWKMYRQSDITPFPNALEENLDQWILGGQICDYCVIAFSLKISFSLWGTAV